MRINRISLKDCKQSNIEVYFIGDFHIGSKCCDLKSIKKDIDIIKKKKNAYAIIMGDTADFGLRHSVGAGVFDNEMNPDEQIQTVVEVLTPIKSRIIGVHNGNHSQRIYNETSISPEKTIAGMLGVPYLGDSILHYIRAGNETYILFTAHGSSSGVTPAGVLSSCMKYSTYINAEIYAMGHSHHLFSYQQEYFEVDKKNKNIIDRKKHFVLTGGYLNWKGGYAEQKGYTPLKIGCAKAVLGINEHKIEVFC